MPTKKINSLDEIIDLADFSRRTAIVDIEATLADPRRAFPLEIGAAVFDPNDPQSFLRPEGRFSALIRPPAEAIFRPGADIERLKAVTNIEDPEFIRGVTGEVHRAFRIHGITPAELFEKGRPIEEVMPEFQSWAKQRGVSVLTAYNVNYDKTVLERFGLNAEWGGDIMYRAREILGLRRGEGSAENVAHLLGVLGEGAKEAHRGLADAELEARIWLALQDPIAVDQAMGKLRMIRGERRILAKTANRVALGIDRSLFRRFSAEQVAEFAAKNPAVALAAAGIGLYTFGAITKPLSVIPGSDDSYNTLTGLNEEGVAAELRKIHTDFGSGYQGLRIMGQPIAPEIQTFREEWFADLNDEQRIAQLKQAIAESQTDYDQFTASEMNQLSNGLYEVDLSGFNVRWDDADTLIARRTGMRGFFFGKDIAVRLTGIDAPEVMHPDDPTAWFRFRQQQPFGEEATQIAEALTAGKKLKVIIDPEATTYGRYIGIVYAEGEARSVNEQLLAAGAAAHLPFGEAGSDIYERREFADLEQQAIAQQRGMWQTPFFQSYLDVSRGVGGRVTFNTFTDLSRLSRNYKLAAAQQMMWTAQETGEVDPSLGMRIGRSLKPSYGRFFHSNRPNTSSRDDDHLQVEALGHGGMASAMRKDSTDFGSGFRGTLVVSETLTKMLGWGGGHGRRIATSAVESGLTRMLAQEGLEAGVATEVRSTLSQISRAKEIGHDQLIVFTKERVAEKARLLGMRTRELYKHSLVHEETHLGALVRKVPAAPVKWNETLAGAKYNAGRSETFAEEFMAFTAAQQQFPITKGWKTMGVLEEIYRTMPSAEAEAYRRQANVLASVGRTQRLEKVRKFNEARRFNSEIQTAIENAFQPEAAAYVKLSMSELQKSTQMLRDTNGLMGGKMHTRYTNKSGG